MIYDQPSSFHFKIYTLFCSYCGTVSISDTNFENFSMRFPNWPLLFIIAVVQSMSANLTSSSRMSIAWFGDTLGTIRHCNLLVYSLGSLNFRAFGLIFIFIRTTSHVAGLPIMKIGLRPSSKPEMKLLWLQIYITRTVDIQILHGCTIIKEMIELQIL